MTMRLTSLETFKLLFYAVADDLHWHLQRSGIHHIHQYLDNFIVLAPPRSPWCHYTAAKMQPVRGAYCGLNYQRSNYMLGLFLDRN